MHFLAKLVAKCCEWKWEERVLYDFSKTVHYQSNDQARLDTMPNMRLWRNTFPRLACQSTHHSGQPT